MADFQAGDRMVKMSGNWAGRYGTVNSVMDNGTLNVTFDGERIPKYCNPELCGKVAANAFKVGDKVKHKTNGLTGIVEGRATEPGNYNVRSEGRVFMWDEDDLALANACAENAVKFDNPNYKPEAGMKYLDEHFSWFDPKVAKAMIEDARRKGVKVPSGVLEKARKAGLIANSRAANAKFKVGDRVHHGNVMYISKSNPDRLVGTITKWDDERGAWEVKFKDDPRPVYWTSKEMVKYVPRNSTAANATFKVGDRVRLAGTVSPGLGKTGVVVKVDGEWGDVTVKTDDGKTYQYEASAVQKVANSACRNDRVKGHFVWFSPWNGRAGEAADEIVAKVPGAKREGANIVLVKDADSAATVYALFRKAKVPTRDLNIGFNSACRNSVEVEVSLSYAGRVQHAMRDAARSVSGVRMTSSNTLVCPDDDAADDVIEIIKSAGVPADEVWTNSRKPVARNASAEDAARYIAAAKSRIRGEVATLKDVANLLKMKPTTPEADQAYGKVVKALATLQRAFAELS